MKLNILSYLIILAVFHQSNAQIVNIPDSNFKYVLVHNYSINTNMDNEIQVNEATSYSGSINVDNKNIHNMTGIEAFVGIKSLKCDYNQLASLNISANTNLLSVYCRHNQLTSLDVSSNISIGAIYCSDNLITTLDLSSNVILNFLGCDRNQLTSLDVSSNLDLYSLHCYDNLINSLDLSMCNSLNNLYCFNNQLSSLNIKNGNNTGLYVIDTKNNPNLNCIQVDDSTFSADNWSSFIDSWTHFDELCTVGVESNNLANNFNIYPNPNNGVFQIYLPDRKNSTIFISNVFGKVVYSSILKENRIEVNITDLSKGAYLLMIIDNFDTFKTLIVIQ